MLVTRTSSPPLLPKVARHSLGRRSFALEATSPSSVLESESPPITTERLGVYHRSTFDSRLDASCTFSPSATGKLLLLSCLIPHAFPSSSPPKSANQCMQVLLCQLCDRLRLGGNSSLVLKRSRSGLICYVGTVKFEAGRAAEYRHSVVLSLDLLLVDSVFRSV